MDRLDSFCNAHALAPTVMRCPRCEEPLCRQCAGRGDGVYCEACVHARALAAAASRKRALRWLAFGSVPVVLGIAALVVVGKRAAPEPKPAKAPPPAEQKIACDRDAVIAATEGFVRMEATDKALALADKYLRQCGELPRLRWVTFSTHKKLGNWTAALVDATKLIEAKSLDQDYWWWRGEVYARLERYEAAAADYRQSIANLPSLHNIPVNLEETYRRLERPCEALVTLDRYVDLNPDLRRSATIQRRIDAARLLGGGCASFAGKGTASFSPDADQLVRAPIRANVGPTHAEGKFVVDEQSSYVVLTRAFADKLGVSAGVDVSLLVAGQITHGKHATVDALEAGGARAERVEVVVVETLPVEGIDGLLGTSFLWRYTWQKRDGGLTLRPRGHR